MITVIVSRIAGHETRNFPQGGVNLTQQSHTRARPEGPRAGGRVLGEGAPIFCISGTHKMPNDAFSMYTV